MNHIEFYENIITDYSQPVDTRVYVRAFYQMELHEAKKAIETISKLIAMKETDSKRT